MADKFNTVEDIAEEYLCNSCGACSVICPENAITSRETVGGYLFPEIDEDKCTNCGQCPEVCPGIKFGDHLKENLPDDPFEGEALSAHLAKATNQKIFDNSQSGGAVTAILTHALENNVIDGAIVTTMKPGNPPRPESFIAKNPDELIEAQKSKYSPVPILKNIGTVLQKDLRIGLVGLPCHIHGLFNLYDKIPELKEKVEFTIGLFCDRALTLKAIDYLLSLADEVPAPKNLHFRDKQANGYPGSVKIFDRNNKEKVFPPSERKQIKNFFTPLRCRLCYDKICTFSDISIGDPWGIKKADKQKGESAVIIRNNTGKRIYDKAIHNKYLANTIINYEDVISGQKISSRKKKCCNFFLKWEKLNKFLPDYHFEVSGEEKKGHIQYRNKLCQSLRLDKFDSKTELIDYYKNNNPSN